MTLRYHLRIKQGETFQVAIPVLDEEDGPVVLSGMTARGQIRPTAGSSTVLHEWTVANTGIALDGSNVVLKVPAATSSGWTWSFGEWDLELVDGAGNVTRLIEGYVVLDREVTRP